MGKTGGDDRKATEGQITTCSNQGAQNTVCERTTRGTSKKTTAAGGTPTTHTGSLQRTTEDRCLVGRVLGHNLTSITSVFTLAAIFDLVLSL